MKLIRFVIAFISLTALQPAAAASLSERFSDFLGTTDTAEQEVLHPDAAFIMSATVADPETVEVSWRIADGYYLYHDKFSFEINNATASVNQAAVEIPHGKVKEDPAFGSVEVNTGELVVNVPLLRQATQASAITLELGYQGCKEDSLCYPPIKKQVSLVLPDIAAISTNASQSGGQGKQIISAQDAITERLKQGGILLNLVAFLGFGLLLSLTPCVFPMIPILSGIIVGQGSKITPLQGFLLSLVYVLALALMYALLGVIAGSFHFNLQSASQNVWAITAFSLVFVALALSMFGFYELQLPAALQTRLSGLSGRQRGGTLYGAAVMGGISAIIVGPCVAPPLAGALLYISQTGNALFGGAALFAMGIGLGMPLLAIGASAGALLPRAGIWMDAVKRVFGVVMLGVAIWFMGRVLPGPVVLLLWALLIIVCSIYMGALDQPGRDATWARLWKGIGIAMLVYGVALIIGAVGGSDDLFRPLQGMTRAGAGDQQERQERLRFKIIKSVADLDAELLAASRQGKPVMLDFYADWCVTCIEMEEYTFPAPGVRAVLKGFVLLQADVTGNDDDDAALLGKFELYGPPAILFFSSAGSELTAYRLVGFVQADKFTDHVKQVLSP